MILKGEHLFVTGGAAGIGEFHLLILVMTSYMCEGCSLLNMITIIVIVISGGGWKGCLDIAI